MHLVIHENWSYGSYLNFLPSFCPSVFVCLFVCYFYIILLTFIQTIFLTCFIFELGRITWISNNTTVFLGGGENSSLPIFKFGILRYSCLIAFNASSKTQGEYYRPSVGWAEMARRKFSSTRWCKSPWEHCPCLEAVVAQIRPTWLTAPGSPRMDSMWINSLFICHMIYCSTPATLGYVDIIPHSFSWCHEKLQSRTKLLENLYPSMHAIERNNTVSTTTDLRYQIPLPSGQCCFLQMSKDQGCFRTHNNIASKGRGEGRTRYSEDVRKNALRMWHFLNSFVQDCSYPVWHEQ